MGNLNHIRQELDKARLAYAKAHPEQSMMLPLGSATEYHIINSINFLVDAVEEMDTYLPPQEWVSNAGPVEIQDEWQPGDRVEWYVGCWVGTIIGYDGFAAEVEWDENSCPHENRREKVIAQYLRRPQPAQPVDPYEGESVDCKWDDYPSEENRMGPHGDTTASG